MSARIDSFTSEEMYEGFLINDTVYIADEERALAYVKVCGYKDLQESYDAGFHYWTEWDRD